jgi:hypothetical protein
MRGEWLRESSERCPSIHLLQSSSILEKRPNNAFMESQSVGMVLTDWKTLRSQGRRRTGRTLEGPDVVESHPEGVLQPRMAQPR